MITKRKEYLYNLLRTFMIYPSRNKVLHRIVDIDKRASILVIYLACGSKVVVRDSRNSRSARWLRKAYYRRYSKKCKKCKF